MKVKDAAAQTFLMTTTQTIPGEYAALGLVYTSVQAGSGWLAFSGGVEKAMRDARKQLEAQARAMGGDAVIGLAFVSSSGALLVSGTAIRRAE